MKSTRRGRRGWADYAVLLRAVIDKPGTSGEIAARTGERPSDVLHILAGLGERGVINPVSTRDPTMAGVVWSFDGPPIPLHLAGWLVPTVASFCDIVNVLVETGGTVPEVAEWAGVSKRHLRGLLAAMHSLRMVFVDRWVPQLHGGDLTADYLFGIDRADKARPRPMSKREESARRRELIELRQQQAQLIFMTAGRSHPSLRFHPTDPGEP